MSADDRNEYGRAGRFGIATPQANATVEPEFAALLPPGSAHYVVRLVSDADSPEARLQDYLHDLPATLKRFDILQRVTTGFACTGSSYLLGSAREAEILAACQQPVITAAQAICAALRALRITRLALIAPYPDTLIEAGIAYYHAAGFEITAAHRVQTSGRDTRAIYALGSADARAALQEAERGAAEAILLSGTGMPSLPVLADWAEHVPLLSSNYCLAWAMRRAAGEALPESYPLLNDWQDRLADQLG